MSESSGVRGGPSLLQNPWGNGRLGGQPGWTAGSNHTRPLARRSERSNTGASFEINKSFDRFILVCVC